MLILRAATPRDIEPIAEVWYRGWRDGHLGVVPDALLPYRQYERFASRVPERLDYAAQVEGGALWVPCHRYEKRVVASAPPGERGACAS